jgi:hypothetical protein
MKSTVRGMEVTDRPLCGRPILPVSLIISGYSFVSTIVVEINSSNFKKTISDVRKRERMICGAGKEKH